MSNRNRNRHVEDGELDPNADVEVKVLNAELAREQGVVIASMKDRVPGEARTRGQEIETMPMMATGSVTMVRQDGYAEPVTMEVEAANVESHERMGWHRADSFVVARDPDAPVEAE